LTIFEAGFPKNPASNGQTIAKKPLTAGGKKCQKQPAFSLWWDFLSDFLRIGPYY
jgi:hypothetical protein